MWKKIVLILILLCVLTACSQAAPTSANGGDTAISPATPTTASSGSTQPGATSFSDLPLYMDRGILFSASGACAVCHQQMVDQAGKDVSVDTLWRSSMLANAARDPYWLATVRSEVSQAPQLSSVIQKKCATCHMPMAEVTLAADEQEVQIPDQGLVGKDHSFHHLAMDGVSCTLCHQIEPDNLGQPDSFSGGFLIDKQRPQGERMAYGPFTIDPTQVTMMQSASGFIPQQGLHMQQSEVCGNCHDLYTPFLDSSGEVAGEFPEQLIYSEWVNSTYADNTSCQDCHMPQAQGSVKLSITGGPAREPVYQHTFIGGNAYMLRMIQQDGEAQQVTAAPEHFEASIARTTDQIASDTARLTLQQPRMENGLLLADVYLENLAGHKFPAGYPSRRAWLHIRVTDQNGNPIFESGAFTPDGAITGNDNDTDPARYEPHYALLTSPEQVQIYEGIMVNSDGQVTTELLRGARFIKDNRLLPTGFKNDPAIPMLGPQGEAAQDPNFTAGTDTLSLQLEVGQAQGPFTLEVTLYYQAIGYRWADNLRQESGAEIEHFGKLYAALPNMPLQAAAAQVTIVP